MIRYFKDFIQGLNEGLIRTLHPDVVSGDITRSLKLMGLTVECEHTEDRITLNIRDFDRIPLNQVENVLDHIMVSVVNRGGWFPATMTLVNLFGRPMTSNFDHGQIFQNHGHITKVEISFEMKFDVEVEIPEKLYKKDLTPIIFEIDGSSVDRLYKDPNYPQGFYTLDNIPKEKIKKMEWIYK